MNGKPDSAKRLLLIVYSNLEPGGIPAKIIDIVNVMRIKKPDTPIVILLQKGHPGDLRSLIANPNVLINDFPYPYPMGRRFFFTLWLWLFILTQKPAAILVFISPYALPVLAFKFLFFWQKFRVIVSEDHYTQTLLNRMAYPVVQRWGIRLLYPLADAVIVPTHVLKHQLLQLSTIPEEKIRVVPNWTRFAAMPLKKSRRTIDIIHIGRLVKSKNPLYVVRIMHRYIKEIDNTARCAVVGDGPEVKSLERYIRRHQLQNNIQLFPATNDVSEFLLKAKIFLFLPESRTEGFPIILLDAMACGDIVITKQFDGVNEVIRHGKNGFVYRRITDLFQSLRRATRGGKLIAAAQRQTSSDVANNNSLKNIEGYLSFMI